MLFRSGPGLASTNLAYLIYIRALLDFDVGGASAGGVIAIVLANIVAIFLIRTVARIGFSDDGEPGGTAGRPMFQALEGSGLGQIAVVVTRYFGGIKLGTGGLVRAYTQAVTQTLESLPRREFTERRARRVRVGFALEAQARHWLQAHEVPVEAADYDGQGVTLTLAWPADDSLDLALLTQRLRGELECLDA